MKFLRNVNWRYGHRITWKPEAHRYIDSYPPRQAVLTIVWLIWVLHIVLWQEGK